MRVLAILFVAAAVCVLCIGDRTAFSAQPAVGGASASGAAGGATATGGTQASGAAQGEATSENNGPTDLNSNNPAGLNPMQQTNPAGGNPASSTQGAINNPPGGNLPATGSRALSNPGTGATINTPRGQIDVGANGNGGLNVDVNRNAGGSLPNAQMRQELREDRQNFRQDLRTQRQENRQDRLNDPNRWRYTYQNGEWWYWQPDNNWVYWRNNQWMPYSGESYQPFGYSTGYRGGANNSSPTYYYDESGRRYRRDYSPLRPQNMEMQTGVQSNGAQGSTLDMNKRSMESMPMNQGSRSNESNEGGTGQSNGANSGAEIGGAAGSNR